MNLGHWPKCWAERKPDKVALKYNELSLSWEEFNNRINQAAHKFKEVGIKKGDRVTVLMANGNIFLESLFAAAKMGAILVPLNFRLAAPELEFIINDSKPSIMIYSPEFAELVNDLKAVCPSIKTYISEMPGGLEGDTEYDTWINKSLTKEPILDSEVEIDDPTLIMYTSGTTGRPKGALILHQNMIWNSINSQHLNAYKGHEVSLCSAPLFHIGGLNISAMPLIYAGCKIIIQRNFDPAEALRIIDSERITFMFGVPQMFQLMTIIPEWNSVDFSSMEILVVGGAPCSIDLIKTFQAKEIKLIQGYGMTESSAGASLLASEYALNKLGSAGQPLFHVLIKIIDAMGVELAPEQVGEIVIKGPNVIQEYWCLPEDTANCIVDGWFHTGDLGYRDEDGFLYITDRKKDMYISGGENVYPAEIELVLSGYPHISEVAIIGIPDEKWGEVGMAIITSSKNEAFSEDEFLAFCKNKLAGYKQPRKIMITQQPLPRTATGKLKKQVIKEMYAGAGE